MGKFFDQMPSRDQRDFAWAAEHGSRKDTLAAYMDKLIMNEDRIEQIVKKTSDKGKQLGHETMYTEGTISKHIRFRIGQARKNK